LFDSYVTFCTAAEYCATAEFGSIPAARVANVARIDLEKKQDFACVFIFALLRTD
jgi:hypothetical protein